MVSPLRRDLQRGLGWLAGGFVDLVGRERFLAAPALFRKILCAWLILHTALLVPYHAEIWAPDAFVQRYPFAPQGSIEWLLTLSRHPLLEAHYLVFIAGQLATLTLAFFGIWPRLMIPLAYLLTMNINSLAGVILDGGNNLAQLVLFFLIFVNTSGRAQGSGPVATRLGRRWPGLRDTLVGLGTTLSTLAFTMIRLQIVLVYICAGIYKLNGQLWSNGMALYYIFQADSYSHPFLQGLVLEWPWISLIGTYFTVAFQVLFPILVWSRRARPWILCAGILLHLGIAFGMGLFTFGLVMGAMYVAFFTEATSARLLGVGGRQPLTLVAAPPGFTGLLRWIRRFDLRRVIRSPEATEATEQATALVVRDPGRGREHRGPAALRELLLRPVLLAPLSPLVVALWYLGALNLVHRRLSAGPSAGE